MQGTFPVSVRRESTRHAAWLDQRLAAAVQRGIAGSGVAIVLWDGTTANGGPAAGSGSGEHAPPGTAGSLLVRDRGALLGLAVRPDLYFGDMYMAGRVEVLGDFYEVIDALSKQARPGPLSLRERLALLLAPANDLLAARRNIHHHYDLGNDFYALWLDPEMVYTCAYYPDPEATLSAAQTAKMDLVCRKLNLRRGDSVIEAGCGWGALAIYMARQYGARVKAYNISTEQIRWARDRAKREGLSGQVEFIDEDYRAATGRFDAFVSVGMLEHVGRRNYEAFGRMVRRLIDPRSGRGLLHFIGRDRPRPLNAWIRRRIFPGAYPPSLAEVTRDLFEPADLTVVDVENLRLHYACTLRHWRERFEQAAARVRTDYGDAFYRAWRLYLAGSEAAFGSGWMQLYQIGFTAARGTPPYWTRAALYTPGGTRDA
jgi:cyclopropane-fatty-acyl-phospholipid synthase